MYGDTPWGYIHQKKRTEEVASELSDLQNKYDALTNIFKKLLNDELLSEAEKKFLRTEKMDTTNK